jgi:hypothetical protein
VTATTLGFSYLVHQQDSYSFEIGGSGTADFLPPEFTTAYGSAAPISAKAFLRVSGVEMF